MYLINLFNKKFKELNHERNLKMGLERIKKLSVSKVYTKEDINLSEYFFNKAIIILKESEKTQEMKYFYDAVELFEKSIITYPKQSKSYIALSFLFWKMNEHENAIILLKKAREFDSFDLNIPKQIKLINDDYVQKQKDKIVQKHASKLINKISGPKKNIISEGLDKFRNVLNNKRAEPDNKTSVEKLPSNSVNFNNINNVSKPQTSRIKENITTEKKSLNNSNNNIYESLANLKSQRENIKIKTSSDFLNKFKLVEI